MYTSCAAGGPEFVIRLSVTTTDLGVGRLAVRKDWRHVRDLPSAVGALSIIGLHFLVGSRSCSDGTAAVGDVVAVQAERFWHVLKFLDDWDCNMIEA